MTESKIAATHRLQREGRWEEASQFRDEMRQQFKREGMNRSEAGDAAWAAMHNKFPPLPVAKADDESQGTAMSEGDRAIVEAIAGGEPASPPDLVSDVNWVYAHLGDESIKPRDIPGLGAWSLWRWARENNNRFFEHLLPKALATRTKTEAEEEMSKADHERIERLGELIRIYHQGWVEELIEDVPATVRKSTASDLKDMQQRFDLNVPAGVAERLGARMVELATKYIAAAAERPSDFAHEKW